MTETVPGEVRLHDLERGRGVVSRRAPGRRARRTRRARGRSRRSGRTSSRTNASCDAKSVASNATVSTADAPAAAELGRGRVARSRACGPRARRVRRAGRRAWRTVASAMSEVPPSTSTDCTSPSASFTSIGSVTSTPPGAAQVEPAVHVAAQQRGGVEVAARRRATRRAGGTSRRAAPGRSRASFVR